MSVLQRRRFLARAILAMLAFPTALLASTSDLDPAHLKPGQFIWHPEVAPAGPVVVVVSLDEQRVYVYRNGLAIGLSTISSGRRGHETPPGIFTILQKDRDHRSNLYNSAPMPYMERLTWDGVALHGGDLPGYPASHGCVRLPKAFAESLFGITDRGETVVVANSKAGPTGVVHPAVLAPVSTAGVALGNELASEDFFWDEAASPEGPVSILVSTRDKRVVVLRNGVRIGSGPLKIDDAFAVNGSQLFVMSEGYDETPSPLDASRPRHRWAVYPISGSSEPASMDTLAAHLSVSSEFAQHIYPILTPGTTIVVTNLPGVRDQDRGMHAVLDAEASTTK